MIIKPNNVLNHFSKDYDYQIILAKKIDYNRASDLLQESYIRLYKRFEQKNKEYTHNNKTADRYYMYTIMNNIAINLYNKNGHYEHALVDDLELAIDEEIDEDKLAIENRLSQVHCELEKLPRYERQLFELYLYSGMSMRDISRETKLSLSSIFSTIKEIKIILKNKIKE